MKRFLVAVLLVAIIAFAVATPAEDLKDLKKAWGLLKKIHKRHTKKPAVEPVATESDSFNSAASAAISWARSKVGGCYSQSARNGPCYDCSSFVYNAYRAAGKNIGATYTGAYPGNTRQVSDMQPGDILWTSGHVALYIGNNQVIHAENSRTGIRQRDLSYVRNYFGVSRIYRPN